MTWSTHATRTATCTSRHTASESLTKGVLADESLVQPHKPQLTPRCVSADALYRYGNVALHGRHAQSESRRSSDMRPGSLPCRSRFSRLLRRKSNLQRLLPPCKLRKPRHP